MMIVEIYGTCEQRFLPLKDAFRANFEAGLEIGSSLAVTHRGKLVVDLWAGYADPARTIPWQQDTIVPVASTTKMILNIGVLVALDRGVLDLDQRVVHYWPEFAQGGKGAVTVRDAITHQAGVPGLDPPMTNAEAIDWQAATARVAAEPHWFNGERRICYHAQTYGFLVGELIRRADGRGPRQFLNEEVLSKVGADFLLSLETYDILNRLARPAMPTVGFDIGGIGQKLLNSIDQTGAFSWERACADNPGGNGFGNGRSIALACGILGNNGIWEGQRILSPEIIALAGTEQAYGPDPYVGTIRWGLGFGLDSKEFPAPTPTSMHWGGFGGSWGLMDPRAGVSLGYTPNNWVVPEGANDQVKLDARLQRFVEASRKVLPAL